MTYNGILSLLNELFDVRGKITNFYPGNGCKNGNLISENNRTCIKDYGDKHINRTGFSIGKCGRCDQVGNDKGID